MVNETNMPGNSSSTPGNLLLYHHTNMLTAFLVIRTILILPLSIFVLYLGLQRWRQQASFETSSHIDIFTYNMSVMELIWVCGSLSRLCSMFCYLLALGPVAAWLCSLSFNGEMLFHVLTCVERYIAVVHPVVYLRLKNASGVRIRNVSIGCVWMLCVGLTGLQLEADRSETSFMVVLVFSIVVIAFCSLSVLHVLIHPGPGEGGREKERVDQTKQRAFHIITSIMSVQLFGFIGFLASTYTFQSHLLSSDVTYLVAMGLNFSNLPSSLVSPLLFLHRAGKLTGSCFNRE